MRQMFVLTACLFLVACGSRPGTPTGSNAPSGDSVLYVACMEAEEAEQEKTPIFPDEARRRDLADLICQGVIRTCQQDSRGDGCKKYLRYLDDDAFRRTGRSLVYKAAYAGTRDLIEALVAAATDVNRPTRIATPTGLGQGWTPLMIAAAEGHGNIVSLLIAAGANINARSDLGRTALMFASWYGFIGIVQDLLAHGADPNIVPNDDTGATALIAAASKGRADIVRILLDAGADARVKDRAGQTALILAEKHGYSEVARMLRARARQRD